jgi:hypothetical protein
MSTLLDEKIAKEDAFWGQNKTGQKIAAKWAGLAVLSKVLFTHRYTW